MSDKMKNIKFLPIFILLCAFFVSCEKPQQDEWDEHYGYTNEDIAGVYVFSNITNAFGDMTESAYCHICEDAKIEITAGSGGSIEFKMQCPSDDFNRTFEGLPRVTDNDFLINMRAPSWESYPNYELTVYVYKNNQGGTRLHGFARHVVYQLVYNPVTEETDHIVKSKVNYYFDVIKN